MAYYEPQGWQAPARQASWEQPPPPSRSGASSTSQRDETNAFATQFEEIDRAMDNLAKSGKFYPPGPRRDGMQNMPGPVRPFHDQGMRVHGGRPNDFDPNRPHHGGNAQGYYASQRHQGRHADPEQMMQAKRRMAAQRERELRNYHQEQQYNRSHPTEPASSKSDRSMSPSAMSEEGQRELIARQRRALYGNESTAFNPGSNPGNESTHQGQPGSTQPPANNRVSSPRNNDPFTRPGQGENKPTTTTSPDASMTEKKQSPTNASAPSGKTGTPPSTADEGAHARQISKSTTAPVSGGGMAPIGSRPNAQHGPGQSLSKRTTSPLPSSLGFVFGSSEQNSERAASSNSNSNPQKEINSSSGNNAGMGAWGTGSGVWGSNKIGTTSVWG